MTQHLSFLVRNNSGKTNRRGGLVVGAAGVRGGGSDFNTLLLISFSEAPYVLGNRDSRPPGYININIYKINFLHQKGLPICQSLIIMNN